MRLGLELVLWGGLGLVAYAYVGYPLLLALFARGRRAEAPATNEGPSPRLTLLIAAHDEERFIARRLENALEMEWPADRLEVLVASDASADRTDAIVGEFSARDPRVKLLAVSPRGGKAKAINAAVPVATGEILAMSDANTFYEPDAAAKLARWFVDPTVGSVVGRLVLRDPEGGRNVDGAYWKYEAFLKAREGRLGALLGANGAIYALRRRDYVPLPGNAIVDDFVEPLLIVLKHGKRTVYDESARAHEVTPETIRSEFRRRARIAAGGFQAIGWLWPLLAPSRGWLAWSFLSHKVLRWFAPVFLLGALAANLGLAWTGPLIYRYVLGAHLAFYALAGLMALAPPARGRLGRLARLPTMFVAMNLALLVGLVRWAGGAKSGAWSRTDRGEGAKDG